MWKILRGRDRFVYLFGNRLFKGSWWGTIPGRTVYSTSSEISISRSFVSCEREHEHPGIQQSDYGKKDCMETV